MGEGPVSGMGIGRRWRRWYRPQVAVLAAGVLAASGAASATAASASTSSANTVGPVAAPPTVPGQAYRVFAPAATPIRHLVVIFQENVSFDHYFGTYPHAANSDGSPFHARPSTPQVNGLTPSLLNHNPNTYNPSGSATPRR